jgi:hypothetical protein
MKRVFLLRAYGDFTIFIDALHRSTLKTSYQVVASKHLESLYHAINKYIDLSEINIQFEDFGIEQSQLNLFTNKTLLAKDSCKQLFYLKKYLKKFPNKNGVDFLEQDKRKTLLQILTNHPFESIVNKNHFVYESYKQFFQNIELEQSVSKNIEKLLLFPDARLAKRIISDNIIENVQSICNSKNYQFSIARFKTKKSTTDCIYENFNELIALIQSNDYIIGADSLPVHLCNLLNKPHFIFFPDNHPRNFVTPFAQLNKHYGEFNQYDLSIL